MDETLLAKIEEHLRQAIDEDDPKEKDFHVRSALQELDVGLEA